MRIGLALSGGGFRATLYHLGMVRYLRDTGLLRSVSHITSVSGGSVLAGHLALNWDRYCGDSIDFDSAAQELLEFVRLDVRNRIVRRYPLMIAAGALRRLTRRGQFRPLTRTMLLERHYQRHLFGDTCLYQLPKSPELHILSTNLSSGGLSSFTRNGLLVETRSKSGESSMNHHRIGLATVPMAVAASSAFPGFFPPLELSAATVGAVDGEFQTQYFTDGGVYDNLGIRMFHHITQQLQGAMHDDDFVDVEMAMQAWKDATQEENATPLRRLVEIHAASPAAATSPEGMLEGPQEFTRGLQALLATSHLHQDEHLLRMLSETTQHESNGSADRATDRPTVRRMAKPTRNQGQSQTIGVCCSKFFCGRPGGNSCAPRGSHSTPFWRAMPARRSKLREANGWEASCALRCGRPTS